MQPSTELVSLIMPVYRPNPSYLRAAIASALAQENVALELIVVDDGSPQPLATLLADITDPRLTVVRVKHGGVSRARNAGIAHSHGVWLRFVDGDDILPIDSTRVLLAATSATHRISYGDTLFCNERLEPVRLRSGRVDGEALIPFLVGRLWLQIPALLFHREVVAQAGPFDERLVLMEDDEFILRALGHSPVRAVRKTVYLYRLHQASSSRTTTLDPARVWHDITQPYFRRYRKSVRQRLERQACATAALERAYNWARAGAIKPTVRLWLSAAPYVPLVAARVLPGILQTIAAKRLAQSQGANSLIVASRRDLV